MLKSVVTVRGKGRCMIVVDMPTRSKEDSTHDPIADEADFVTSMVKHGFTAHFAGSRQFTPPLGSNFPWLGLRLQSAGFLPTP